MTKTILLNNGESALVDDEDHPLVSRYSWRKVSQMGYAGTTVIFPDGTERTLYMHQLIMATSRNVDHENHNTLDNQKNNIRVATYQQNGWNKGKNKSCRGGATTSKYKGVSYRPLRGVPRWLVYFKHVEPGAHRSTGKLVKVGYFFDEDEAARQYNKKIAELRGEWAWFNPVEPRFPATTA